MTVTPTVALVGGVTGPVTVRATLTTTPSGPGTLIGRRRPLVVYPAGGMGPYSYQWSGGGGTWSGNRMTMGAPLAAVTATLTVTDSSSPARQRVSVVQTIPVSPVVTEDALYAAVLNRIWAVENFGNGLDAKGTGGSYFHNLILSQANLQQPILTPAQYASLVTLAMNYRAEQANDAVSYRTIKGGLKGAQPQSVPSVQASLLALTANQLARTTRYLTQVQAQTGLGNPAAPTAFDTYAWSNYAPSVECEGGGGGSGGDSAQIYLDNYLGQDPGTLEMEATADAWIAGGFEGGYDGTQVEMTLSLYDSSGNGHVDEAQPVEYGPGGATAWVIWTPRYPGDPYTSYAWAGATAYDAEDDTENVYADSFVTLNTLSACIPIPSISGAIMVDGVPTNGFVLPASGTKTGTLTIGGECMAGVTGISFPGLSGLTATVTQTTAALVTASYSLSSTAAVGMGYLQVSNSAGLGGVYSPVVVAPSLPFITQIIAYPNPWQAGSSGNTFTIYGAGFGTNPTVSIALESGLAGVVVRSCAVFCSDAIIEGTVTLPPEAVPDTATVSITYNGYGSAFQSVAPPSGTQILGAVPVNALFPQVTVTAVQFTNSYPIAADYPNGMAPAPIGSIVWTSNCPTPPCSYQSAFAQGPRLPAM